jgi:hypothetical protein
MYTKKSLYTYENAFNIAKQYIPKKNLKKLDASLKLIFDILAYNCYMVCVGKDDIQMYKLESLKTSPIVKNILIKEVKTLRENPTLSQYNIKYITNFLYNKDKIRLLQCIVKQINLFLFM